MRLPCSIGCILCSKPANGYPQCLNIYSRSANKHSQALNGVLASMTISVCWERGDNQKGWFFFDRIFFIKFWMTGYISVTDSSLSHAVSNGHQPVLSRLMICGTSLAKVVSMPSWRSNVNAGVLMMSAYTVLIPPSTIKAAAPLPMTLSAMEAPFINAGSDWYKSYRSATPRWVNVRISVRFFMTHEYWPVCRISIIVFSIIIYWLSIEFFHCQ